MAIKDPTLAPEQPVVDEEQRQRNQRAIGLLRQWREDGDEDDQRQTFEALKEGLNTHHSSGRRIFP